ncbi:MAG: hypothetical protein ABI130_11000 [Leifsonia sp.]
MSKTGGGRGTNQHQIRGTAKATPHSDRDSAPNSPRITNGARDWDALLREFPTYPGDFHAVPEPSWDDLAATVADLSPRGADRALARYQARESLSLFNDARLEGFAFTEPEIVTLMGGGHVAGHTIGEEAQVTAMGAASKFMAARVSEERELEPSQSLSDDIHLFIAAPLRLKSVAFRGAQKQQYAGPEVRLSRGARFRALDARMTPAVLESGLARITEIDHPVLRGATWAAFATYQQFYLDGNKRTGRYVMNTVLMSHGYDAITVHERLKAQYEDALVESYETADLTPHISFLLSQYADD